MLGAAPQVGPFSLLVARPYGFLDVGLDYQATFSPLLSLFGLFTTCYVDNENYYNGKYNETTSTANCLVVTSSLSLKDLKGI